MKPNAGRIVAGKYELVCALAQGGMGSVWVARHSELDVDVAVKFMDESLGANELAVGRFRREAKAAARLKSPHVTRIHDYGVEDGTPYMVMELLEGQDLRALLKARRRLSMQRVAAIVSQLAKALDEAHRAGIIHRDLKPANIFLAQIAGEEMVKVLDFGIAKETKTDLVSDQTSTGALVGSPRYMSPEQARGSQVDPRSDLWSVAVVVYEALTGQRAFTGEHLGDIIAAICGDELPVASKLLPELGDAIDAFFARGMARNPDQRFQSAREMAQRLAEIARSAPEWTEPGLGNERDDRSAAAGSSATPTSQGSASFAGRWDDGDAATRHTGDDHAATPFPHAATLAGLRGPRRGRQIFVGTVLAAALGFALWVSMQRRTDEAPASGAEPIALATSQLDAPADVGASAAAASSAESEAPVADLASASVASSVPTALALPSSTASAAPVSTRPTLARPLPAPKPRATVDPIFGVPLKK